MSIHKHAGFLMIIASPVLFFAAQFPKESALMITAFYSCFLGVGLFFFSKD